MGRPLVFSPHARALKRIAEIRRKAAISPEFKYKLRARFLGTLHWNCPSCGIPQRSILARKGWAVQCSTDGYGCAKRFVVGLRLLYAGSGIRMIRPEDYVVPDDLREAYPIGDVDRWMSRWPAHMLIVDRTREFAAEVRTRVEKVIRSAGTKGKQVDEQVRRAVVGMVTEKLMEEWNL